MAPRKSTPTRSPSLFSVNPLGPASPPSLLLRFTQQGRSHSLKPPSRRTPTRPTSASLLAVRFLRLWGHAYTRSPLRPPYFTDCTGSPQDSRPGAVIHDQVLASAPRALPLTGRLVRWCFLCLSSALPAASAALFPKSVHIRYVRANSRFLPLLCFLVLSRRPP